MQSWLAQKSADDETQLANRAEIDSASLPQLAALANKRLNDKDVRRVAKSARGAIKNEHDRGGLVPVRLCLASQTTADFFIDDLLVAGLRNGLLLDMIKTDYNQLADLAFGDFLNAPENQGITFTFVGLDYRQLGFRADLLGNASAATEEVASKLTFVRHIVLGIAEKTGTACLIQNLVPQPEQTIASIDARLPGSALWMIDEFNRGLAAFAAETGHILFDAASLASNCGYSVWHDRALWFMAKAPFSQDVVPLYAQRLAALLAAAKGKAKKVLILDLDNTLWGGVIGDDGVNGIRIGQGSAAGEAFLDIQRTALALKARGIVLAVCSKNTDEVARKPFQEHPDMLLKLEDFAVFTANWEDKASNISHMAKTLELGLDSFVFLDDNPAERELVRRTLPKVTVPEVGDDPATYPLAIIEPGFFEALAFSEEDRARAKMYQENAKRAQQMEQIGDFGAYLNSLNMAMTVGPVSDASRERVVQLINKSNQFNLTTRRYTVPEMLQLEQDSSAFTLQVRLTDSFGDNGIIAVVLCLTESRDWVIDTWLMSCRVLKRRVEEQMLQYLVEQAAQRGIERLIGIFKPTERNGIVVDHYKNLGFTRDSTSPEEEQRWVLSIATYQAVELPFQVLSDTTAPSSQLEVTS